MGLVKTRRLAAMQKQQRAKALKPCKLPAKPCKLWPKTLQDNGVRLLDNGARLLVKVLVMSLSGGMTRHCGDIPIMNVCKGVIQGG